MVYTNQEVFHPEEYGEKRIDYYSTLLALKFDQNKPSWNYAKFETVEVIDNSQIASFGLQEEEYSFHQMTHERILQPSSFVDYPSRYKFHSFELFVPDEITEI